MREQLATKYIKGRGIEIGGLHFPLPVPPGAKVRYVDHAEPHVAGPDVAHLVKIKELLIDDAEYLTKIEDYSLDFIIANHVFEHCHDPIGTLKTWARKLVPGGIVYAAIPEKTQTFDRDRKITTLQHLINDHEFGASTQDEEHYREWFSIVDKLSGQALEDQIKSAIEARANIHFHVWDDAAMFQMFNYAGNMGILYAVENVKNGAETIWILRK